MKIAGIEVSDKIAKQYEKKVYDVPGEKTMPYSTIELLANSQEVAEGDPELRDKCKAIVDQVRAEVVTLQRQENGLSFKPKHDSFTGYVEDLKTLYESAAAEREELKLKHQKAVDLRRDMEKDAKTDLERSRAKTARLEADENYAAKLRELQERTNDAIREIKEHFTEHVTEFYSPSGARLDADTVSLLNSGLRLKESELNALFQRNKNNVTMLRLLGDYAEEHKIKPMEGLQLYKRAMSGGKYETEVFDYVSDMVTKAVSSDEVTAKVWSIQKGHFDRLCGDAIQGISGSSVKPEL